MNIFQIEMRNCERLNREGQSSHSLDTNLTQVINVTLFRN